MDIYIPMALFGEDPVRYCPDISAQASLLKVSTPEVWARELEYVTHLPFLVYWYAIHTPYVCQKVFDDAWQAIRANVTEIVGYDMLPATSVKKIWPVVHNLVHVACRQYIKIGIDSAMGIKYHIFGQVNTHNWVLQTLVCIP